MVRQILLGTNGLRKPLKSVTIDWVSIPVISPVTNQQVDVKVRPKVTVEFYS